MKSYTIKHNLLLILPFLAICTFLFGFILNENSAGAGGLSGDFKNTWKNLNTFLNHDLATALEYIKNGDREYYVSSRTPILYILNAMFNPFTSNVSSFIKSIFFFSFFGYLIFYKALIEIFKNTEKKFILIISSCLLLSPYYRTSAFWGAEENYGIISTILTFFFFNRFENTNEKIDLNLFLSIFFSSLTAYFDQKLIIVPILIFLNIFFFSKKKLKIKIFTIFNYFIFSLPFIYFIISWKNIVPVGDATDRGVGKTMLLYHPLYLSTMVAFYIFPLILFKKNLLSIVKHLLKNKLNITLIILYIIYLIFLLNFHDMNSEALVGKGIVHKFSYIFIESVYFRQLFICFVSLCSFILILLYIEKKLAKTIFIIFLYIMSIFTYPLQQEYFDPIILIFFFGFLDKDIIINRFNSIFLFSYLVLFLISANIYYYLIL